VSPGLATREFDYIIIGGGAAGCALAARLSERADLSVLLIEAGGRYRRILSVPLAGMRQTTTFSWKYFTSPQPGLSLRRISLPFGKVLGGSSSINAMMYVRGSPGAYDRWAELGNAGWSFAEVLPYFRKSERFEGGASEFHGDCGPIHVSYPRHRAPFSQAFVDACVESGIAPNGDFNGPAPEGAGFFHVMQRRGRRCGAATSYLGLARGRRNLRVALRATVHRIIVKNDCAIGVELSDRRDEVVRAIARREVLLSAGALNSPKVLMLSGIGPGGALERVGIKCLLDLPGVGANFQDHVRVPVLFHTNRRSPGAVFHWPGALFQYALARRGALASNCCESGAFVRTDPARPLPDLQFVTHFQSHLYPGVVDLQFCLVQTRSRGQVTLDSADPRAAPRIDPNYLSDPADVRAAIAGVRRARQIAGAPALRRFSLGSEVLPGSDVQSDLELEAYCRSFGETCYHPSSTCRMGADVMSVVDTDLRVHGLDRLRIVDASVMPELPNGNTCAATYMIAEKAADLVLAQG
jgi:choline dehydrogenase